MYIRIFVIATILFSLAASCHKTKEKVTPATFTTGIDRTRNWRGHHHYEASGMHFPTPIKEDWDLPDTTFALTRLNDTQIVIGNLTLDYESSDSRKQVHYFGGARIYYSSHMSSGIAYFYAKDSIVWVRGDRHGTNDIWILDDVYHTY